ncbi:hypothetical protein NDU88_002695 [Pleurodeles waltl]|uniref:Cystin-1 n=1 Tax=Pleurodeles waltl TaxID=8319 RepID=A0AAV7RBR4_PLEWA|nr:hypothetical protein NDU88_002695 [Pleurodeles waltl]
MGSGSSVARRSRGRSSGAAPRSRSPSPGSCSDPCRVHGEEPPVGPRDCLCPRLASGHPPGTEEDDDTDGELDKALAEFEDLCEPRRRQPQTDEGASSGTCDRVPGSSPMLIPSLELEGTAASAAPGRALPSTPLRDREMPSWGQGHCSTSCSQEHHGSRRSTDLFTRNTKDEQNIILSNKCHSRSNLTSDSKGQISYDLSEEELMSSIEREY